MISSVLKRVENEIFLRAVHNQGFILAISNDSEPVSDCLHMNFVLKIA